MQGLVCLVLSLAVAAPAGASTMRFQKVSIKDRDDMIGGEAFTFLAPVGWKVEGGIVWRVHPVIPAAVSLRVTSPGGVEQLEAFPTLGYTYGGMAGPGGLFPVGSFYYGNEVQPPVADALKYLESRHLPRVRGKAGARVVQRQELPKLAQAVAEADPPARGGPPIRFTAGRIRIEYQLNGKPVEEDLYCVLTSVSMPDGRSTIQVADKLYGMRAPKGRLDEATRVFQTMVNSTRPNLKWMNRYVQLTQALTRAELQRIKAAGELSRYISQTHAEVSESMRRSYEERQASQDRIGKSWSQVTRGVDEYYDAREQKAVELPSGYGNAWVNGRGEYVVTDSLNFNPNVELGGDWRRLEPKGPP
jgi:hypothetical protein